MEDAQVDLHLSLAELLTSLNQTLRGWANYFGTGCRRGPSTISTSTPGGGSGWLRAKHKGKTRLGWKELRRRFCDQGWRFASEGSCSPAPPASK